PQAKLEPLVLRGLRKCASQSVEERVDRHDLALDLHLARVELGDVEQVIEQLLERFDALENLVDELAAGLIDRSVAQRRCEQAERMQRLAQVVVRGREEPRLRAARFLRLDARVFSYGV